MGSNVHYMSAAFDNSPQVPAMQASNACLQGLHELMSRCRYNEMAITKYSVG